MHINPIRLVYLALVAVLGGAVSWHAAAASFPEKPVRVIIGFAPGGATDIQARLFAQKLSDDTGQTFVVDNRPGAGSMIGANLAREATPDGYTLLAATTSFTIAPQLQKRAPYDPARDFAPVALMTKAPYLLVSNPKVPVKSMKEYIAYIRSSPGKINHGVSGFGSLQHLGSVWLQEGTSTNFTIITFKGTGPALLSLFGNEIQSAFANPVSSAQYVKSGRLRALAVTTGERAKAFPDVPTIAESGVPGYDLNTWHGWVAPKDTPKAIIARLNSLMVKVAREPDMERKLEATGALVLGSSPAQFAKVIAGDSARYGRIIKRTGIGGKKK